MDLEDYEKKFSRTGLSPKLRVVIKCGTILLVFAVIGVGVWGLALAILR